MRSALLRVLAIFLCTLLVNGQDEPAAEAPAGDAAAPAEPADIGDATMTSVLPDITEDKNTICEAVKREESEMKVDINGAMDYDDLLRLTVWNAKYNLRMGVKRFDLPGEVNWKRDILTKLATMFTTSCQGIHVPPGFIHVTKELFMIYLNSVNSSDHSHAWQPFMGVLEECQAKSKKFDITSLGFSAVAIEVDTKEGQKETVSLLPPAELADSSADIDVIIDTIWWLFSFSFGNCFWNSEQPTIYASRYKRLFYLDFLNDLKARWLHAGTSADFGVIYGDFNLPIILRNIRVCVTGAYVRNGIADKQLVRSIMINDPSLGMESRINRKLGTTV